MDRRALARACEDAREVVDAHAEAGIDVISYYDEAYPLRLRELTSPPNILFALGNSELLRSPQSIAVVGTREPSVFGISATAAIVHAFAAADFITVSGLARGIDAVCAITSLDECAPTVAVLGGGLDVISPSEHSSLARDIVERGGLLVSEHANGVPTLGRQLVARNRLQSGLACALVVGQTPIKSGTMHTVRFAAEQGRPIYCAQPLAALAASEGNRVLLETAATALPDLAPAFAATSGKWREQHLGAGPLAAPITRDNLEDVVEQVLLLSQTLPA
jgi:DNA processing protein